MLQHLNQISTSLPRSVHVRFAKAFGFVLALHFSITTNEFAKIKRTQMNLVILRNTYFAQSRLPKFRQVKSGNLPTRGTCIYISLEYFYFLLELLVMMWTIKADLFLKYCPCRIIVFLLYFFRIPLSTHMLSYIVHSRLMHVND